MKVKPRILFVTSDADSGPGTLRQHLSESFPRIIVLSGPPYAWQRLRSFWKRKWREGFAAGVRFKKPRAT